MTNLPDGYAEFIKKFFKGDDNYEDFLKKHPDFEQKSNQLISFANKDSVKEIQKWYDENVELVYECNLVTRTTDQQRSMLAFLQKQTTQKDTIKLKDTKKIIDFGCGTGLIANFLWWYFKKEFNRDISVVGVDFSSKMLEKANEIKKKVKSEVIFLEKDITKIEVEDKKYPSSLFIQNSADIIIMNGVEVYPTKIARIIYNLLLPNGIFITSAMTSGLALDISNEMTKKHGFQMLERKRISKDMEDIHLAFKKKPQALL